jgi:drug/metabolite transporter (DMT)-like permease
MTEALAEKTQAAQGPQLSAARLGIAAIAVAAFIHALWGTNPIALKIALREVPPIGSAGIRFAIASIGVAVWSSAFGARLVPRRGEAPWLAAVGAIFIVQIATFTLGVHWGTASHSTVLLNTYPFFVVAMAHFLIPGDRATPGRFAAVLMAFIGVAVLFGGEWGAWQGTQLLGDSVQLTSAFLLGAQIVFLKYAVTRIHPARVVLWQMLIGAAAFLMYSFAFEGLSGIRPGARSVAAVVYQGVVIGTLCFTIWAWLLRRYSASRVAIFGFISPLVGVALSVAVLGEPFTPALLVSAALVAAGIVIANL